MKHSASPYSKTGVNGVAVRGVGVGYTYAASPPPIHLLRVLQNGVSGVSGVTGGEVWL